MSDFMTNGASNNLEKQLQSESTRVDSYVNIQRGIDIRSGNIIIPDKYGDRRCIIGSLPKPIDDFIIAISVQGVDVMDELGLS